MACQQACFDCPYQKLTDKLHLSDSQSFDLSFDSFTEDGGYKEIICEEQGEICFGQIQMIANGRSTGLDEFSELGEAVAATKPNTKDFFRGPWEFMAFHTTATDALDGR